MDDRSPAATAGLFVARDPGGTDRMPRRTPRRDPYLRDQNISSAAGLNLLGAIILGALMGWAVVGWFDLRIPETVGVVAGAVAGAVLASVLLSIFGGRSTR